MKKTILISFTCLLFSMLCLSQNYITGIGLRGGYTNGLTIKHFVSTNHAIEGIISTRWKGVEFTGLYEFQKSFMGAERLDWFIGIGGHVGFWNGDNSYWGTPGKDYTVVGLDGILGLEYSFREVPISIGLDWKPEINLFGYTGFWADGGSLTVRYIF